MVYAKPLGGNSNSPFSDPTELLDTDRFANRNSIEDHLIDGLIPAVFSACPNPDENRRNWNHRDAERWLRFLARHLDRLQTHNLAWWELPKAVPSVAELMILLMGGATIGLVYEFSYTFWGWLGNGFRYASVDLLAGFTFGFGFVPGLTECLVGGLVVGLAFGLSKISDPEVDIRQHRHFWRSLGRGLAVGLTVGLVVWLTVWLAVWLERGFTYESVQQSPMGPYERLSGFVLRADGLKQGLTDGFLYGITFGLAFTFLGGVAFWFAESLPSGRESRLRERLLKALARTYLIFMGVRGCDLRVRRRSGLIFVATCWRG